MAKHLRYTGEFLSRAGDVWRVDILQESDIPFGVPNVTPPIGELIFESENTLVIDWKSADKETVICGSEATLRIESPGDRTYQDLYTIEPGNIRMDVYRENALYWSGALDPEFYEEPYEKASKYVVTFVFSDFGILDRLKYNLVGMQTLQAILMDAVIRSTINYISVDTDTYCTTYFEGAKEKASPTALAVRSENFFDEDGEACTLKEVIEGILQPLGLKMIQRCGKIYVYDLNGLHSLSPRRVITWDGDSQTMGVDKVANNVKISFSPYGDSSPVSGDIEYTGDYDPTSRNYNLSGTGSAPWSYYPDCKSSNMGNYTWDYDDISFRLWQGSGKGLKSAYYGYFKIEPIFGGNESEGVVWCFSAGTIGENHQIHLKGAGTMGYMGNQICMQTNRAYIPKLSSADAANYYLRLSLDALVDARYNPFSTSDSGNEKSRQDTINEDWSYLYVPVAVALYDESGTAKMYWDNFDRANAREDDPRFSDTLGKWVSGTPSFGRAWLEYYDPEDRKHSSGTGGWQTNRQTIGMTNQKIRPSIASRKQGQYIPYPEEGGYLEVTVYGGLWPYIDNKNSGLTLGVSRHSTVEDELKWLRWHLYKAPKVEIVNIALSHEAVSVDDVEYSGYLNRAAKEEISIDTICGTTDFVCPTAKGIYLKASDGLQIRNLCRANVTDHPEKLLIGTLYSQYAERRTTLQGEAVIDTGGLCTYTERNQEGKVFMMSEEVQDVIADTTEARYTEFRPDEYEAVDE